MPEFKIKDRIIGPGHPCYVIAEMSANHAGSFEKALAIVRAAKEAGADAIKLQTYTPDTMTIDCDNKYFRLNHPLWGDKTLYQLYQEAQTPWEWHEPLKQEAEKLGLHFFSTPFDETAVDFLESLDVPAYKVASFELVDDVLLAKIARTKKPVIMSTGMSTIDEISHAVNVLHSNGTQQLALLRCVSSYPAKPEEMRLILIKDLHDRFDVVTGLSDHTVNSVTAVSAVSLGASIIEKHLKLLHEDSYDAAFSLTPLEFKLLVHDVHAAQTVLGNVQYGPTKSEANSQNFRRSIFVVKDINAGQTFSKENIRIIRPGQGMNARLFETVIGKRAVSFISRGTPLFKEHIA